MLQTAAEHSILLKQIDYTQPLGPQGPFDVIIHKLRPNLGALPCHALCNALADPTAPPTHSNSVKYDVERQGEAFLLSSSVKAATATSQGDCS
jgi:hypothetical protein